MGRHAPGPLAARPWCAFRAPGPCCLGHPAGGFRHGCARWPGWSTRSVVHAGRPAPSPLNSVFSKGPAGPRKGGGVWGRAPQAGRRWATRPRRWAARVQPQAVPAVHGLGEVVHGRPGSGRSGSSEHPNRANIFSFAQPTRAKPRQYWVSREPLYKKKIGDPDCTTLCNLTTKCSQNSSFLPFKVYDRCIEIH